ncbi:MULTISPECIES: hypothetical protein [Shewanella]|uniref:DUF695 domain-containing protein n=1 Tax=Shewanella japonica TaxID=93973 RepID=A0ABN4YQZ3_9GAMM|nr:MULTISPECIES: hypothetical protein [Shewanella]ARD23277.1 hypothetical protein SJ2017_3000 [Shewanella japonica]
MCKWICILILVTSFNAFAKDKSYSSFCEPVNEYLTSKRLELTWSKNDWDSIKRDTPFSIKVFNSVIPVIDLTDFTLLEPFPENTWFFGSEDKGIAFLITVDRDGQKKLNEINSSPLGPKIIEILNHEQRQKLEMFYQNTVHDIVRKGYEITPSILQCDKIVDEESFKKTVDVNWFENWQTLFIKNAAFNRDTDFVYDINGKDYGVLGKNSFSIIVKESDYRLTIYANFEDSAVVRQHFFNFMHAIKHKEYNLVDWNYFGKEEPKPLTLEP